MKIESFVQDFESAVDGIPAGSIKPDTKFHDLPQWDSLALLSILALVDGNYNVQVSGKEVQACTTIEDLFKLVAAKGN